MISLPSHFDTLQSLPANAAVPAARSAKDYDAELVQRFNGGDESAFVEIVARYRGKMFATAFAQLRNRADAEEIAQDTFIRAHRSLARFRGDSSLAGWLHRITINLSRNRYWYFFRRRQHDMRSLDTPVNEVSQTTYADFVASEAPDPVRDATNHEFIDHVTACMAKLSDSQREILTLRNFMDHSYEDMARNLGLSLGTVKSRIARARKNLRALLAPMYEANGVDAAEDSPWFESSRPAGISRSAH